MNMLMILLNWYCCVCGLFHLKLKSNHKKYFCMNSKQQQQNYKLQNRKQGDILLKSEKNIFKGLEKSVSNKSLIINASPFVTFTTAALPIFIWLERMTLVCSFQKSCHLFFYLKSESKYNQVLERFMLVSDWKRELVIMYYPAYLKWRLELIHLWPCQTTMRCETVA